MPRYVFYVLYGLGALLFFLLMVSSTMGANYLVVHWILGLFRR